MRSVATQRPTDGRKGRTRGTPARQEVVNQHLGLVHHLARQMCRSRAAEIELDDLVSAGTLGLIDAVDSFDPARGLAFSTFAAPRIRGAMLDELRRQDRVPRSVRRRARAVQSMSESLTISLGRTPADGELAHGLGIDVRTLWRWQADLHGAIPVSLDGEPTSGGTVRAHDEHLADERADAMEALLSREELGRVRDAILELAEQERTVLSLYYFEELRLADIARALGVSESRVSQIRSKAVERLRTRLGVGARQRVAIA